jgi:hypothetical protein
MDIMQILLLILGLIIIAQNHQLGQKMDDDKKKMEEVVEDIAEIKAGVGTLVNTVRELKEAQDNDDDVSELIDRAHTEAEALAASLRPAQAEEGNKTPGG